MRYMLFTYRDPSVELTPEQRAEIPGAVAAWCDEMEARGVRLGGHVLAGADDTRRIRTRDGETVVSAGPIAPASLQIAGFNILECADLEEALEVASSNPGAKFGVLELRPIEE